MSADPTAAAGELSAAIRRLRVAANVSHAEIARQIGFSPVHVARAERDETGMPSVELVRALDRGLDARGDLIGLHQRAVAERQARHARTIGAPGPDADAVAVPQLAAEIRRLRRAADLSQAGLAHRIGYSPAYVSLAERETQGLPSANLVDAIDRALGAAGHLVALRRRAGRAQRALRRARASARDTNGPLKLTIEVAPSTDGAPDLAGFWRELATQATHLAATLETDNP